jgi:phosphoribosylaminoimidazole-succinocarboxamide synthase
VRDYLEALVSAGQWNKEPPPPALPQQVIEATSARYLDAFRRLAGMTLDEYIGAAT